MNRYDVFIQYRDRDLESKWLGIAGSGAERNGLTREEAMAHLQCVIAAETAVRPHLKNVTEFRAKLFIPGTFEEVGFIKGYQSSRTWNIKVG